jgi:hypothetical protein
MVSSFLPLIVIILLTILLMENYVLPLPNPTSFPSLYDVVYLKCRFDLHELGFLGSAKHKKFVPLDYSLFSYRTC